MPIYRATHADAPALVKEKEGQGETVVSVSSDDGGIWIATSKPAKRAGAAKETRG